MPLFDAWRDRALPVIGMVHLPALPGAPRAEVSLDAIVGAALDDVAALVAGEVDGVVIENFGDAPFHPGTVPAHTIAAMTAVAVRVRGAFGGPMGINVLRNDGHGALAVALAAGADFIRVNVLSGVRSTDQGLIEGAAHELLRWRRYLDAGHVRIFADVNVKHSAALAAVPVELLAEETVRRAGADALIVSGTTTGRPADGNELDAVRAAAHGAPVFVGSGVDAANVAALAGRADGVIVGTALKAGGDVAAPVDGERVKEMTRAARKAAAE